jgi:hypothetical protein
VSPLYLYAVLGAAPAGALGTGLAGEPLRLVECDGFVAAAGEMAEAPALAPDVLRGHDTVVRRLAANVDAVLPARFGATARDVGELRDQLARAGDALREALARVAGREQMILRVYAEAASRPRVREAPLDDAADPAGPGASYLRARARTQRTAGAIDELAPIRPVLDRLVVAERVERHDTPPLLASVYHLVRRGEATTYRESVERAGRDLEGVRLTVSGPWAPYAFAPETLA